MINKANYLKMPTEESSETRLLKSADPPYAMGVGVKLK